MKMMASPEKKTKLPEKQNGHRFQKEQEPLSSVKVAVLMIFWDCL